ncbi:membrane protein [Streptomyces rimosus subsp. pseudoverticillatus]|uniref:YhgE/Pip domain-containing protein n=1 Tax=Streptomyces rimosus TaxID=1927 RepID=UPI0006B2A755|nr:YhgE/Pip domain-containing protein [Streptomyces rimosus]KOT77753.1 membrane protein [Streptomyces rimosus subsp. pseudoverticillatus]
MRSPKLAALELKRFGRGKLPRLGLVALMLIPLLYGALYLCSFWDPYANLDKIPVALVNDDKGATAGGKKIQAGDELVKNVKDSNTFNWEEVSASDAEKGVENGTYYLSLTVPKDFSERIASSSGDHPETGALQVRTNDANNYIVGSISKTIFSEIRAKTSAKSSREFFDKIFVSFSDLHDKTQQAADGAGKIDKGLGDAKKGSDDLSDGLGKLDKGSGDVSKGAGTLHDKAGELSKGAGAVNKGAGDLNKGAGDLNKGAGDLSKGAGDLNQGLNTARSKAQQLSAGAGQVANGTQQLADKVNGIAKKDLPFLKEHGKEIGEKAKFVADLSQAIYDDLGKLPGNSAKAATQARKNADDAAALYREQCGGGASGADCARLKGLAAGSAAGADAAEKVNDIIARTDLQHLRDKLRDLHQGAALVADKAPGIATNAEAAIQQINALNAGAKKVSQGAGQFADGIGTLANGSGKLADGSQKLTDGTGKLADGSQKLTDGTGKLADGSQKLTDGAGKVADGAGKVHEGVGSAKDGIDKLSGGIYKLKDGSNQLAGKLDSGVAQIPDYDKKDRDARTEVMSNPVELASKSMHKAPNYGTGLAPYFIPLSLWVGAMVAYMLLAPLGKRALAAGAPGWRIALGSWLPAFAIGVVQVLALMAVLHWGLGLEMERAGATIGFLLLATAAFTAIIQFFGAQFGPAGRVLTLVVLMLQLTSAGGTYPVQTSPGFFGAIHPFLPMSYVVDGLRRLITGGDLGIVWQGSIVLAAFTVGALALTSLTARSRQVVRMKDLHPELSL